MIWTNPLFFYHAESFLLSQKSIWICNNTNRNSFKKAVKQRKWDAKLKVKSIYDFNHIIRIYGEKLQNGQVFLTSKKGDKSAKMWQWRASIIHSVNTWTNVYVSLHFYHDQTEYKTYIHTFQPNLMLMMCWHPNGLNHSKTICIRDCLAWSWMPKCVWFITMDCWLETLLETWKRYIKTSKSVISIYDGWVDNLLS